MKLTAFIITALSTTLALAGSETTTKAFNLSSETAKRECLKEPTNFLADKEGNLKIKDDELKKGQLLGECTFKSAVSSGESLDRIDTGDGKTSFRFSINISMKTSEKGREIDIPLWVKIMAVADETTKQKVLKLQFQSPETINIPGNADLVYVLKDFDNLFVKGYEKTIKPDAEDVRPENWPTINLVVTKN